jgi:transcription elongation factor Elf1
MTMDQLAVKLLLDDDKKKLAILLDLQTRRLKGTIPCPDCGNEAEKDCRAFDLDRRLTEYACEECETYFTDEIFLIDKGIELNVDFLPSSY